MAQKQDCMKFLEKKMKKFALGCDVDKEEIFDYPYLSDKATINFIEKHGRIMFIIRGPNSTLKATLSDMITEQYSAAQHCCADHYFSKTFMPKDRTKETLALSHIYCQNKVEAACKKNDSPIIVQNTHIRKYELQVYLDFAAMYNYTVIMAITLYKFEVTPEALERVNPDGLNVHYFRNRLKQWEDIAPLFTAWFLCPDDVLFILYSLQKMLSILLVDEKFCNAFNSYDNNDIWNYFNGRRNLYCIAGYHENPYLRKKYYLSDLVQESYGKSFDITFYGYLVTLTGVMALVCFEEDTSPLVFDGRCDNEDSITQRLRSFNLNSNTDEYKTTIPFNHQNISAKTVLLKDWENEVNDFKNCKLIHVAHKNSEPFDIIDINYKYNKTLNSLSDEQKFIELKDKICVSRLPDDQWLVKLPQKIIVKTLFTGLYV